MQRIPIKPRSNLEEAAIKHGFVSDSVTGIPYWDESAYYQFTLRQIEDDLEGPAEEIEGMCFEVVARAIEDETILQRLGILEPFWDYSRCPRIPHADPGIPHFEQQSFPVGDLRLLKRQSASGRLLWQWPAQDAR